MAQAIRAERILELEEPIGALASQALEHLMDTEGFEEACHKLVCREMGLHTDTRVGGDADDRARFYREYLTRKCQELRSLEEVEQVIIPSYLTEDDPRFDMYWEKMGNLWATIFAEMIALSRHRWGKRGF